LALECVSLLGFYVYHCLHHVTLHQTAGAGKTVLAYVKQRNNRIQVLTSILSSAVVDVLQDKANTSPCGDVLVGFAFLRYSETLSARGILAALVRQALERHPHLQPLIAPIYERHRLERTQPTQEELVFMLVSISKQFRIVFFAIDGLDEAHRSVRLGVLKALPTCNVKLFLTSRPLERIESLFPNVVQFMVAATEEDIERLIDEKLDETPALEAMMKTPSLKREVISKVASKSKGM
jgi:ankyrin repeat domain-containing protein 50